METKNFFKECLFNVMSDRHNNYFYIYLYSLLYIDNWLNDSELDVNKNNKNAFFGVSSWFLIRSTLFKSERIRNPLLGEDGVSYGQWKKRSLQNFFLTWHITVYICTRLFVCDDSYLYLHVELQYPYKALKKAFYCLRHQQISFIAAINKSPKALFQN